LLIIAFLVNIVRCRYDTQDGPYDIAWSSEIHKNQLRVVASSGDGSICDLWNGMLNVSRQFPPTAKTRSRHVQEHSREVFSVDWKEDTFSSSSWDGNVKLVSLMTATFPNIILDILALPLSTDNRDGLIASVMRLTRPFTDIQRVLVYCQITSDTSHRLKS
jgi:WD40 repeat protein